MTTFLQKIGLFWLLLGGSFGGLVVANNLLIDATPLAVHDLKTVLVLGDSNPQCAVDDKVYTEAINLSNSSDSYFYSYLKLKKVTETEPHIETVLLGFSPHNIIGNNLMFTDRHLFSRLAKYYPLMDWEELEVLVVGNPRSSLNASRKVVKEFASNVVNTILGRPVYRLGFFQKLNRNLLEEAIEKLENNQEVPFFVMPETVALVPTEVRYLQKIVELCRERELELVLLSTPKREELLQTPRYGLNEFYAYYDENLSDTPFLDFSRAPLADQDYADLVHLNASGSTRFSAMLHESGLTALSETYKR